MKIEIVTKTAFYVTYYFYVIKVKVKLSLRLNKHHAMKAYWENGDISPRIL
jgi:hypothetical protein